LIKSRRRCGISSRAVPEFIREELPSADAMKLFEELEQPFKWSSFGPRRRNGFGIPPWFLYRSVRGSPCARFALRFGLQAALHRRSLLAGDERNQMMQRVYEPRSSVRRSSIESLFAGGSETQGPPAPRGAAGAVRYQGGGRRGLVFWYPKDTSCARRSRTTGKRNTGETGTRSS